MRLLYIVGTLGAGGAEALVREWSAALTARGWECSVACIIGATGVYVEKLAGLGVRVLEVPQKTSGIGQFVWHLTRAVRLCKPDVVHSQCAWSLPQQAWSARMGGAGSFVLTVHSVYPIGTRLARLRRRLGTLLAGHVVKGVIGVSDAVSEHAIKWLGVPSSKVWTIRNGIQLEPFLRGRGERDVVRNELGIPLDMACLVNVAGLSQQKDQATLLRAFAELVRRFPEATLLVVGDGAQRGQLLVLARALGIERQVRLLGLRHDVPSILQAADVFVLSSRREGLPLALVEAQAAGLPAVATRVGGVPEVVEDGVSGLLVPPQDPLALAAALETVIRDRAMAVRMGQAARENAVRNFSIERCTQEYVQLYQRLAAGAGWARPCRPGIR